MIVEPEPELSRGVTVVYENMSACSSLRIGSLFITGANRGIGLEFVKQLTGLPQPPRHIFATCRNPSEAKVFARFGCCGIPGKSPVSEH